MNAPSDTPITDIPAYMADVGAAARRAATAMAAASTAAKDAALRALARRLREAGPALAAANEQDLAAAGDEPQDEVLRVPAGHAPPADGIVDDLLEALA